MRYRYTGMEKDEESGLNYNSARFLHGQLGRWVSVDPAGLIDGVNTYRYSRCNPIANTDKSGNYSSAISASPPVKVDIRTSTRIARVHVLATAPDAPRISSSAGPSVTVISTAESSSPSSEEHDNWAMRPAPELYSDARDVPVFLCGGTGGYLGESCDEVYAREAHTKEQRYLEQYREQIRRLLANGEITSQQYGLLQHNASRGYIMDPNVFVSGNTEMDPDKRQQVHDSIALGFKQDPKTVPYAFRIGKAGETMAAFSLANSPIGGPKELATRQYTLKDETGKTARPDPLLSIGSRKPDMPIRAEGGAVGTVEVKTPVRTSPVDPIFYLRSHPDVQQQMQNEQTIMAHSAVTWGPAGGLQYSVVAGEGIGLTTGFWVWKPSPLLH